MKHAFTTLAAILVFSAAQAQTQSPKGDMQFDMRDMSLAISTYETALQGTPNDQDIIARIAEAYVVKQDLLAASQWYEKIIDTEGVKPIYILEYAHVLKSLRLFAKARFYYQKYGQFHPDVAAHFVTSCDMAKIELGGDPYYKLESPSLNSRGSDFAPYVLHSEVIYSSFRSDIAPAQTRTSKKGIAVSSGNTVFIATNKGNGGVTSMPNPMSNDAIVSHVRYSEDGKWVAFHKSDFREGQRLIDNRPGKISLYVGEVSGSGDWVNVKPFSFNSNDFSTGYPAFSPDGSALYFSSTNPKGAGGWDIYVSFRAIDGWTAPQEIGGEINTPGNEIAPFYSDHKLFFSSDWHPGNGGFDVFKATSTDGKWINVRSMGYPVNSSKDDVDFVWEASEKKGYFSSNRIGTMGGYDIYSCTPLFEEVEMTVLDQSGKNAVSGATISFIDGESAPVMTDAEGKVIIHQRLEQTSRLVIRHENYKDLEMSIRTPGEGPAKYEVFVDRSLEDVAKADPIEQQSVQDKNREGIAEKEYEAQVQTITQVKKVVVGEPEMTSGTISTSEGVNQETVAGEMVNSASAKATVDRGTSTKAAAAEKKKVEEQAARDAGMYAIQIAAARSEFKNLGDYSNLSTIGKVMQYSEKDMYKIRVGYYKTPEQAKNALASVKSSGYQDAFIVTSTPVETKQVDTGGDISSEALFVRLGTYSKPEYFQEDKVSHLGGIERRKSGSFTIMILGPFQSTGDAKRAMSGAKSAGFKDAFIVNTELKKLTF